MEAPLPPEATTIDPALREVGQALPHQQVVFGQLHPENTSALMVVRLVGHHPEGIPGRFYGARLRGLKLGDKFVPWRTEGIGEVRWDPDSREWKPHA